MRYIYFLSIFLWSAVSCISHQKPLGYGLNQEFSGYVPARIAVLPCIPWPLAARYAALPLNRVSDETLHQICQEVDRFVVKGFQDQPYMRGYSPKWVKRLLEDAGQKDLLEQLPKLWALQKGDCRQCQNPASYYMKSLAHRPDWRQWLSTLSQAARNADAVLIPFVLYAQEKSYDDRGLFVKQRSISVALFLVETNHGYLLWSNGREAYAVNQIPLTEKLEQDQLAYPEWERVFDRLFVENLWQDFPGRQIYE